MSDSAVELDLSETISALEAVPDEAIASEIRRLNLSISDDKYHAAFSYYGVTRRLTSLTIAEMRGGVPPTMVPDEAIDAIRWSAAHAFRGYTAFVYMRSETLETGLDAIDDSSGSALVPFRRALRRGRGGTDAGPAAQRVRNAIAHGTFQVSDDSTRVFIGDGTKKLSLPIDQFERLCEQIFRFYVRAFEASRDIS